MVTKRARTWIGRGALIAVVLTLVTLVAASWHYSSVIEREMLRWADDRSPERIGGGNDPRSVGLQFTDILIAGPLGDYPVWWVEGSSDQWVILVHGTDADRREALRILPAIADTGAHALVVTYRNGGEAPGDGVGRFRLGRTEWADLRAATMFARAEGARGIVLYGFGAGAQVVGQYLIARGPDENVAAVVLDAPMLDAGNAVTVMAQPAKVPGVIVAWSQALATFRFGTDWSAANLTMRTDEFDMPLLVFHGDADDVYPLSDSESVVGAVGGSLVVVPGAGHGEAWNRDPVGYERAVVSLLVGLRVDTAPGP